MGHIVRGREGGRKTEPPHTFSNKEIIGNKRYRFIIYHETYLAVGNLLGMSGMGKLWGNDEEMMGKR